MHQNFKKKKSGHQYRTERLAKEKNEKEQLKHCIGLQNWFKTSNSKSERDNENVYTSSSKDGLDRLDGEDNAYDTEVEVNAPAKELTEVKAEDCSLKKVTIVENTEQDLFEKNEVDVSNNNKSEYENVNVNDPTTWNLNYKNTRSFLVQHGPEHVELKKYPVTNGRCFKNSWIFRNEDIEKKERKWLFYCKNKDAVYCFPCLLFVSGAHNIPFCQSDGFRDWKHLNPQIQNHENSWQHINNFTKWKLLEKGLEKGGLIDDIAQAALKSEILKWRHTLTIILKCILFCAENNLAFRGHEQDGGIFLNLIKFVSQFDVGFKNFLESHITNHASYLSPTIQNEFINLVSAKVQSEIIKEIQEAKYYSIIFDSTPDVSHKDQLTEIIRYVKLSDNKYTIEERFVGFINTTEKTGEGIALEIKAALIQNGLSLADVRGQGYDNGANMAGKYKGVKAILQKENPLARYIPCCAHSLNLVGVHAASINADVVTFFGTIQALYTFFSSSTSRWEKISSVTEISLKKHTDTRWCSKANAVSAVYEQLEQIILLLNEMKDNHSLGDALSVAKSLHRQINSYKFIVFITIWNLILEKINKVNLALQKKDQDIYRSSLLIKGLVNDFEDLRTNEIYKILAKIDETCIKMKIEPVHKRKAKRKRMPGENAEDEGPNLDKFKISCFAIIDSITMQLKDRFVSRNNIAEDFNFLTGKAFQSFAMEDLESKAGLLSVKYPEINKEQFIIEIKCFKYQMIELWQNKKPVDTYHLDLLNVLATWELQETYPNIERALKTFLTMPTTVATAERSFSKLNIIKNT